MLLIYVTAIILMSTLTYILMYVDKHNARHGGRRVPERVLFIFAFFGGAIGGTLAMKVLHHKSRRRQFVISFPLFVILHLVLTAYLIYYGVLI